MAYDVKEVLRSGKGDYGAGTREYTRTFLVRSDVVNDTPDSVAAAVPIAAFASYPTDLLAWLKSKEATQRTDDRSLWDVVLHYDYQPLSTGQDDGSGGGGTGDPGQGGADVQPDLRPPTISIDTIELERPWVQDVITNADIVASNGQPFDPPATRTVYHPLVTITVYKAMGADSYANMLTYVNKVNDGAWFGFGDQRVLCRKYKLESELITGHGWFWKKTLELEIEPDNPWNPQKILDQGTYERFSMNTPPYKVILDETGNPITSPVPLDGSGHRLAPGNPLVYLDFNKYKKQNFAAII